VSSKGVSESKRKLRHFCLHFTKMQDDIFDSFQMYFSLDTFSEIRDMMPCSFKALCKMTKVHFISGQNSGSNIYLGLTGLLTWFFSHLFHHCAVFPMHLTILYLTTPISGKGYKLWSSSLCNFLQPSGTSYVPQNFKLWSPQSYKPDLCSDKKMWFI
jgi:hypothetical protein